MSEDPRQPPVDPRKYALQLAIGSTAPNASTDDIMNRATRFLEFVLSPALVETPPLSWSDAQVEAFYAATVNDAEHLNAFNAAVRASKVPTPLDIAKYTDDQRAAADAVAVAELEHYDAYQAAVIASLKPAEYPDFHTEQPIAPPPAVRWYDPNDPSTGYPDDKRGPDVV